MLRVLTLATLYPNPAEPGKGSFVARQTERLARRADAEVVAISPLPRTRLPAALDPYRRYRDIPRASERGGLIVHYPRFSSLPLIGWRWHGRAIARAVRPLAQRLHAAAPFDVIDAEYLFPDAVAAWHLSKMLDIPFAAKARGSDVRYWARRSAVRDQLLAAGSDAAGLLAVSEALRREMIALGLPEEKIGVHYTGVDVDAFFPSAATSRDPHQLIAIGNLVSLKRFDLLVGAMEYLPRYRLEIIGEGPERPRLERLISSRRLGGRIRLAGRIPHEDVPARLAGAAALLHASRSEGLANVWIEALAAGTPVVTCDVGGAGEVLGGTGFGRLLPVHTHPRRFGAAVRALLHEGSDPDALHAYARRFSWEANTRALHAYLSVAARRLLERQD